jgi:hypothetical protein
MQDADRSNALSKSATLQKQISCDILEIPAAIFVTNPIKILMRNLSRFIQNWSRMKNGYSLIHAPAACSWPRRIHMRRPGVRIHQ